jgi:large subunit ribosomal protein L18
LPVAGARQRFLATGNGTLAAEQAMADKNAEKQKRLDRRKHGIRKALFGTQERPRLAIFRSDKHIYAQVVDDYAGRTLAAAASTNSEVRGDLANGGNISAAKLVGKAIAERAKAAGVTTVAFDRGGRAYHGRIKALADAAREGGLQF